MTRFKTTLAPDRIAGLIGANPIIRFDTNLDNVTVFAEADTGTLCFLENMAYLAEAQAAKPGLVLVPADFDPALLPETNLLPVPKPYFTFVFIVRTWQQAEYGEQPGFIAPTAIIGQNTTVDPTARIGANCVIGDNCRIGKRTVLHPGVIVMDDVTIGEDCLLHPRVTIQNNSIVGDRVILHPGVVIGSDGFGYLLYEGRQEKIPQMGNVVIGNDVEVGSNTTIDRGTLGSTTIGEGTKIDNLVQIGHNCRIGKHSILCGHVGLAGSSSVGDYVYLAGQVGLSGHQHIGDRTKIGAQSGVLGDVAPDSSIFGSPAVDAYLYKRMMIALRQLPDFMKKAKKLLES